jgi:phospholipid transport system transporter-binding protein
MGSGGSTAFRLIAEQDGRFAARGPLTFATARLAREQGLQALAEAAAPALEIDCSGITHSDSAGLAVLLEWLGTIRRAGRTLRYTHLPEGLVALGRISDVEELLGQGT